MQLTDVPDIRLIQLSPADVSEHLARLSSIWSVVLVLDVMIAFAAGGELHTGTIERQFEVPDGR